MPYYRRHAYSSQGRTKVDPAPKDVICYGLWVWPLSCQRTQVQLRFVAGRPSTAVTSASLARYCAQSVSTTRLCCYLIAPTVNPAIKRSRKKL
jgi:hypothetical protein